LIYNGDKIIPQTYCFDPHGVAAQFARTRFPETGPVTAQVPRITVRSFRPEDFREWLLAHKADPGDRIIICTYAVLSQQEAAAFKPTLVYLDADNRIKDSRNAIPVQVA
jgi:hypothetical protein